MTLDAVERGVEPVKRAVRDVPGLVANAQPSPFC